MRKHGKLGQARSRLPEQGRAGAALPQSFRAQSQRLNTSPSPADSTKGLAGEVGPNRSMSKRPAENPRMREAEPAEPQSRAGNSSEGEVV